MAPIGGCWSPAAEGPTEDQSDKDEQKGSIGQFCPGLKGEKESREKGIADSVAAAVAAGEAQRVERTEGNPLAAGNIELTEARVK